MPPQVPEIADLKRRAADVLGASVDQSTRLHGGGSEREFHRLTAVDGRTLIAVIAHNRAEARDFLAFTAHLEAQAIPVPGIPAADAESTDSTVGPGWYLMEDLGNRTLAAAIGNWRLNPKHESRIVAALEEIVRWLAAIQVRAAEGLDAVIAPDTGELDSTVFRADLERFFTHGLPWIMENHPGNPSLDGSVSEAVRADLETLLARLDALPRRHFCYRDFQARNIMWLVRQGPYALHGMEGPVFLDYQSGRPGHPAYDLASLLYSSDTGADEALREHLMGAYLDAMDGWGAKMEREEFLAAFNPLLLIRRLQALGAFADLGKRGKPGYLERIPPALEELGELLRAGRFGLGLPALEGWLGELVET